MPLWQWKEIQELLWALKTVENCNQTQPSMDELLAFVERIATDPRAKVTIADLLRFRILAKRVVCPVQTRDRVLSELQQAFASQDSRRILFTSHVLVFALNDHRLATSEFNSLFANLVEVPEGSYSFGGKLYAFPRQTQYQMLAKNNPEDAVRLLRRQPLFMRDTEWSRASAAVYSVARDSELLLNLVYALKLRMHNDPVFANEVLLILTEHSSQDEALGESLLALYLEQYPGTEPRLMVESALLRLAGERQEL